MELVEKYNKLVEEVNSSQKNLENLARVAEIQRMMEDTVCEKLGSRMSTFAKVSEIVDIHSNQFTHFVFQTFVLVSPGRKILKEGSAHLIRPNTQEKEQCQVFLFNDKILLCAPSTTSKRKLRCMTDMTLNDAVVKDLEGKEIMKNV